MWPLPKLPRDEQHALATSLLEARTDPDVIRCVIEAAGEEASGVDLAPLLSRVLDATAQQQLTDFQRTDVHRAVLVFAVPRLLAKGRKAAVAVLRRLASGGLIDHALSQYLALAQLSEVEQASLQA